MRESDSAPRVTALDRLGRELHLAWSRQERRRRRRRRLALIVALVCVSSFSVAVGGTDWLTSAPGPLDRTRPKAFDLANGNSALGTWHLTVFHRHARLCVALRAAGRPLVYSSSCDASAIARTISVGTITTARGTWVYGLTGSSVTSIRLVGNGLLRTVGGVRLDAASARRAHLPASEQAYVIAVTRAVAGPLAIQALRADGSVLARRSVEIPPP